MAQAGHALVDICIKCPAVVRGWWRESNNLVVLSVPDEASLRAWETVLLTVGVRHALFTEPDLGDEATAIAIAPSEGVAELVSDLPLAGRELV